MDSYFIKYFICQMNEFRCLRYGLLLSANFTCQLFASWLMLSSRSKLELYA